MGTSRLSTVSPKLLRIAQLAKQRPKMVLTTLAHHIDVDWLREAYRRTRKDGAVGVDGQTAADYEEDLEGNLQSLLDRLKSGTYKAPPVRRVHIPKGEGRKTRPIGVPTLEDKVLQRAVVMVLEAVYEQDFRDCSYGFRPGRSPHQALETLFRGLTRMGGAWVVDADISSFFDTLDKRHLRELLDQRVRDGVLRRAIDKWLKAGVLEEGRVTYPKRGTPQGGVISPILANIYLHEVLDEWFTREVLPRMVGHAFLVRFADDFVVAFELRGDAERFLRVLPKRLARFGLTLHPEKTRLVHFRRPPLRGGRKDRRGTFDFLGFTHYWGRSRKGRATIKQKTAAGRLRRTLKAVAAWCRRNRHLPVKHQHAALCRALLGHYAYYGITNNWRALNTLRDKLRRIWRYWLNRRSRKARMLWRRFTRLLKRYPLPPPRIVHSVYGRQRTLPFSAGLT